MCANFWELACGAAACFFFLAVYSSRVSRVTFDATSEAGVVAGEAGRDEVLSCS